MTPVIVAFGSNIGDRSDNVARAISSLERVMLVESVSALYETEPMYVEDQPPFLNGVVVGATEIGPIAFVTALKVIERQIGRQNRVANGPREIDLDLIAFGSLVLTSNGTVPIAVPHPKLRERRFVLEPLFEVSPKAILPRFGLVETLLHAPEVQKQSSRRVNNAGVPVSRSR